MSSRLLRGVRVHRLSVRLARMTISYAGEKLMNDPDTGWNCSVTVLLPDSNVRPSAGATRTGVLTLNVPSPSAVALARPAGTGGGWQRGCRAAGDCEGENRRKTRGREKSGSKHSHHPVTGVRK